jgi:hypothetical protein
MKQSLHLPYYFQLSQCNVFLITFILVRVAFRGNGVHFLLLVSLCVCSITPMPVYCFEPQRDGASIFEEQNRFNK